MSRSFNNQRNAAAANLTPTFEDLSIDDNLSELQRIVKYAKSSIGLQRFAFLGFSSDVLNTFHNTINVNFLFFDRLVHVKMLASVTATIR